MTDKSIDKCIEVLNNSIIYSVENADEAVQTSILIKVKY